MRRIGVAILTISALAAVRVVAQPAEERGFRADGVYQVTPYDVVDLFTGNVHVTIPIGQKVRVSDSLSYQITLRYAGKAWRSFEYCTEYPGGGGGEDCRVLVGPITHNANAGFGWSLAFGELRGTGSTYEDREVGYVYESPDGAEHHFFKVLHDGDAEDTGDSGTVQNVSYTRDGTYLRMKALSPATRIVEFPDGEKHRFVLVGDAWQLTHIYNGFSTLGTNGVPTTNYVAFTYPQSAIHAGIYDTKLTDSEGREQIVRYRPAPVGTSSPSAIVSSVSLTTFRGGTTDYAFEYKKDATGSEAIVVAKPFVPVSGTATSTLAFLSKVTLPSGEAFEFDYAMPSTASHDTATIQQMILPTLGKVEWDYEPDNFAAEPRFDGDTGVSVRRVHGRSLTGAYKLEQFTRYTGSLGSCVTETMTGWSDDAGTNAKVDDRTQHHFIAIGGPWLGLPIHLNTNDSDGRYLSTESYDCDPMTSVCTLHRRSYLKYEMDAHTTPCESGRCLYDRNRRVESEKVVHVTDGNRYVTTDYSEFDGLGNFRKTYTTSSFGPNRMTWTKFNFNTRGHDPVTRTGSSVGDYVVDDNLNRGSGDTFVMLQGSDAWVLGTDSGRQVGIVTGTPMNWVFDPLTVTQNCFDVARNFLLRRRTLVDDAETPVGKDLLAVYTADSDGNLAREEYFGGDSASLSQVQNPCAVPTPHATGTFWIDHSVVEATGHYTRRTQYKDTFGAASGTLNYYVRDTDFDQHTGRPWKSRDSAGIVTTFDYDALGRLTWVKPDSGHGAWTEYEYRPATTSSSGRAEVAVRHRPNGSTTGVLAESLIEYDALGRIFRERKRLQDGSWSTSDTRYDHAGRKAKVSVTTAWGGHSAEPSRWTTTTYDAFGRPLTITTPDAKSTQFSYVGARLTTRTFSVATSATAESPTSVVEEHDAYGRLIRVREASDTTQWVEANYTYDLADRLRLVSIASPGTTSQQRTFVYDGRGYLTSESHPESGTTSYEYDSRANVTKRTTTVAALSYTYDRAERLKEVSSASSILKQYTYTALNSSGYSRGKLLQSTRHHRDVVPGENISVVENYRYDGIGGALSSKATKIGASETFTETYAYSELGAPLSITYPECTGGECNGMTQPARTVTNRYVYGHLAGVGNYADPIEYHPNGLVKSIRHRNASTSGAFGDGPLLEQTLDPATSMHRPYMITVSNVCTDFRVTDPPDSVTIVSGQSALLSATVPGATQHQWFAGESTPVGTNSSSLSVSPGTTTTYWLRASNGTCTVDTPPATVTVMSCAAPPASITAPASIAAGASGNASVVPTSGASYAWTIAGGTITGGAGTASISFRAGCSGTVSMGVTVTASCGTSANGLHTAAVTSSPSVSLTGSMINQGASGTLSVSLQGTSPWTLTWSDGVQQANVSGPSHVRTVSPSGTTSYTVTAADANGCTTTSNAATVTVVPPAPVMLGAAATASDRVLVSWSFSGSADSFVVERFDTWPGSPISYTVASTSTSMFDLGRPANRAALYRVRAVKAGTSSAASGVDLATTTMFIDDPIVLNATPARAVHITELRTAVNAVRTLAGLGAGSFSDPGLASTWLIRAVHVTDLRTALDAARAALGLPATGYADPGLNGTYPIRAVHLTDLRGGVR